MIDKLEKTKCTGCFSCVQKCPKKCIDVIKDEEGFLVPAVNMELCIGCDLCEKACPQLNPVFKNEPMETYAAYAKEKTIVEKSTSGGVFAVVAATVLKDGGVVFGVEMTDEGIVRTCAIEKPENLYKLQGSKYVQANTRTAYEQVREYLQRDKMVLFSGTPCQVAGLYAYLGKEHKNLYTVEVVCHGVPSQELFDWYRAWLAKKLKSKIVNWSFRNKEKEGWAQIDKLELSDRVIYRRERLDPYTYTYLKGYSLRESCYNCQYCCSKRCADITVGDYWGISIHHPEFNNVCGVSLLLINTEKGRIILDRIKEEVKLLPSNYEFMKMHNSGLVDSFPRPFQREMFYRDFKSKTMDAFVRQNMKVPPNVREIIRQYVPKKVRSVVKNKKG
ncbi:Coenzyme F420 hydrogenase/dehydrogenase, beta subunit C-terminal domain [Huintestinicola butyrica]|jgi:Pyruvate/2-oxoacid:ferredoxin oxidoreductase delta subunit/uncharacterized protein YbaA (DUF1428 family)|uniref:Coenzyme F420 hydrogenase/dehydrogenase, beta subunit C-terminal domain n=1 Tax=Huintestinicola butyrica TaxID=2981728 RepID=UPI003F7F9ABB